MTHAPHIPGTTEGLAVTRERLEDGSIMAAFRASAPPGAGLRSVEDLAASLDAALSSHPAGADVYVFGYGSLMWNPAFDYLDAEPATVAGWHRRFCIRLYMARGAPETPGLMLALDRGGTCEGVVFRISGQRAREELALLWQREMLSGAYEAEWVTVSGAVRDVAALTFVVNRQHRRYAGDLDDNQVAHFIATGRGRLGTCAQYFENTVAALKKFALEDAGVERIREAISARPNAAGANSRAR
jgi:cation transport protein ChaC